MEFDFKCYADLFTLCEPDEEKETFCGACMEMIRGQAYHHKNTEDHDEFWIHQSCTKLPPKIIHPLHSQHPLTLCIQPTPGQSSFICKGCGDFSEGFTFSCQECEFNLDINCGLLMDDFFSIYNRQMLEERDRKANLNHFSHEDHTLNLCNLKKPYKYPCPFCLQIMYDPSYACLECEYFIHEACGKLSREITYPDLHSHTLTFVFKEEAFICYLCRYLSVDSRFNCKSCWFDLDVKCALLMDDSVSKHDCHKFEEDVNIYHFSHQHILKQCKIAFRMPLGFRCVYCDQKVKGSVYGCLQCKFFIHESCKDQMHQEVQHPYHPQHTLLARVIGKFTSIDTFCSACDNRIKFIGLSCEGCDFHLHYSCAKSHVIHHVKNIRHEHNLLYFTRDEFDKSFECGVCNGRNIDNKAFYRCLDCNVNIHFQCLALPLAVEVKIGHDHLLHLLDSIKHDFEEYYCDVCEEKGNPNHHLYYCEECPYFAHIDCVITNQDDALIRDSETKDKAEQHTDIKEMSYHELKETDAKKEHDRVAEECSSEQVGETIIKDDTSLEDSRVEDKTEQHDDIKGETDNTDDLWIGRHCLKLPWKIPHPLHSQHPLTLCVQISPYKRSFICDGCRDLSNQGVSFNCQSCEFNLDVGCGLLMDDYFSIYSRETFKGTDRKASIHHFSHKEHSLKLCNLEMPYKISCDFCSQIMYGSAYACIDCNFFIHEPCTKVPPEIKHPFHNHPLTLIVKDDENFICSLCRYLSYDFIFRCKWCWFDLDVRCALLMNDYFSEYDHLALEAKNKNANIIHFSHKHILQQCNISITLWLLYCFCCQKTVEGSAYCCLDCSFIIHELCKDNMQQEVRHPYHPQHTLLARSMDKTKCCNACAETILLGLSCEGCDFHLHYTCAKPRLTHPTKYKHHEHKLFYFGTYDHLSSFKCHICNSKNTDNKSFYRCLECNVNFHFGCLSLPYVAVKTCHHHPLTLLDSVRKHDFEEFYYCDICEEKGNPEHHLYYCEECPFFAHIDCVITEDDNLLEDPGREDKPERHNEAKDETAEEDQLRESSLVHIQPYVEEDIQQDLITVIKVIGDLKLEIGELTVKFDLEIRELTTKFKLQADEVTTKFKLESGELTAFKLEIGELTTKFKLEIEVSTGKLKLEAGELNTKLEWWERKRDQMMQALSSKD